MKKNDTNSTAVIVQCRLSSSRLPGKALKLLGGKTVLEWALNSMSKVEAKWHYVATDYDSFEELKPIADKCGWNIFCGPLEDVLERYCMLIKEIDCSVVIRATADNPFLFYEAAIALCAEFTRQNNVSPIDYMTWTGLPHGCGVEIFKSSSLLQAASQTKSSYDREHVGPALYNHKNTFTSVFLKAPVRFYNPDIRTTIDTLADYRKAVAVVDKLSFGNAPNEPYTAEEILSAFTDSEVCNSVLFFPVVKKGFGTGHLRRCLSAVLSANAYIYISENHDLEEADSIIEEYKKMGIREHQIVSSFPEKNEYSLIVADAFSLDEDTSKKLYDAAPLCFIDDGSSNTLYADYLLDVIPSLKIKRQANLFDPSFITKSKNRKTSKRAKNITDFKNILVCLGGEDPANLTLPAAVFFAGQGRLVTAISSDTNIKSTENVKIIPLVYNLKDKLYEYDLVVTHYGLTAFEALHAGCAVILLATSELHKKLAEKYNFLCLDVKKIKSDKAENYLCDIEKLYPEVAKYENSRDIGQFVKKLALGRRFFCPVCASYTQKPDAIEERTERRTFRKCSSCGMTYISWSADARGEKYEVSYFDAQYKNQYGKTYLEDFDSIKNMSKNRLYCMNGIIQLNSNSSPSLLDIGCAYGPFLSAAADMGWQPYGTEICGEAVEYIRKKLLLPVSKAEFPDFDPETAFGISKFDAVTMWYVIEHFKDLKSVLNKVNEILNIGGVFAFSTPNSCGVSGRFNRHSFFENSPLDHYSLWNPETAKKVLSKFGFKVIKIVSTGHHPERFPNLKGCKKDCLKFKFYGSLSKVLKFGDTFEVYCRKER